MYFMIAVPRKYPFKNGCVHISKETKIGIHENEAIHSVTRM